MIYGYLRVSTDGQSVAAQVTQLRAAGAEKVFRGDGERRENGKAAETHGTPEEGGD